MRRHPGRGRWNGRPTNYDRPIGHQSLVGRPRTSDVEFLKQLYKQSDEDVLNEFSKKVLTL